MTNLFRCLPRFLFLCGLAAFLVPLAQQELEYRQDAEEYAIMATQITKQRAESETEQTLACETEEDSSVHIPIISQEEVVSVLPALSDQSDDGSEIPEDENPQAEEQPEIDLDACSALNPDFIAWLQISGTFIDYPVVQSGDTDYYLHHFFTGKKSSLGCLFSLPDADYETPGRNISIYGHHMRTGDAMFSSLIRYKEPDWLEEHSLIRMNTLFGSRTYRVFAVINYSVGDWDPSISPMNDRDFRTFLTEVSNRSLVQTGVAVKISDHILTLITCDRSYGGVSGRLAVLAVQE